MTRDLKQAKTVASKENENLIEINEQSKNI